MYAREQQPSVVTLDQRGIGTRRHGGGGQRLVRERAHDHGTLRGGVVQADIAAVVAREEALAEVLGGDGADTARKRVEAAHVLQGVTVLVVAHREPLIQAAVLGADDDGVTAVDEGKRADAVVRPGDLHPLYQPRRGLVLHVEVAEVTPAVRDVQLAPVDIQDQVADLAVHRRQCLRAALDRGLAQRRFLDGEVGEHDTPVGGDRRGRGLFGVALDGEQPQRGVPVVHHEGSLAERELDLRRDPAHIVGVAHLVAMAREHHAPVREAVGHRGLRGIARTEAQRARADRQQRMALDQRAVLGAEKRRPPVGAETHADLRLFFQRQVDHVGVAGSGVLGGRGYLRAFEQRQNHGEQIEEDRHDGGNHAHAPERHGVAEQPVLHHAPALVARALEQGGFRVGVVHARFRALGPWVFRNLSRYRRLR